MPGYDLFDSLWFDEQSVNDPKQIESDQNNRLLHHYNSLGTNEERIDFLLAGTFDAKVFLMEPDEGGDFVQKKKNLFSPQEKQDFGLCVGNYLHPYRFEGTPDYDEFERRMDELASRIAEFHEEQWDFQQNADLSAIFDAPYMEKVNREYITKQMCPASIQRYALTECLRREMRNVDPTFVNDYLQRKRDAGINGGSLYGTMNEMVKRYVKNYDPASEGFFIEESYSNLSKNESLKVNLQANQTKVEFAAGYSDLRVWMLPEKNITIESLEKLSNLNDQLKDADHWYHRDSKAFKQFKAALQEAQEKFDQYKGRELTDAEKQSLTPLYDKVAKAADDYLTGKEKRTRKTDMGQERYDIAFSALHITSRGRASETIQRHNMSNEERGSKKISVKDLEKRAGRTSKQQKEYKKAQKEAAKQKGNSKDSVAPMSPR